MLGLLKYLVQPHLRTSELSKTIIIRHPRLCPFLIKRKCFVTTPRLPPPSCQDSLQDVNIICFPIIGTSSVLAYPHSAWLINRQFYLLLIKHHQPGEMPQPSATEARSAATVASLAYVIVRTQDWMSCLTNETEGLHDGRSTQRTRLGSNSLRLGCYSVNRCLQRALFVGPFLYLDNSCPQGIIVLHLASEDFSRETMCLSSIPSSDWAFRHCSLVPFIHP